ncbi:MAG TPA: hypothetical protein VGD42_11805 [Lysobacter sp.]
MPYVVEPLPELSVIRVRFEGPLRLQERARALDDVIALHAAASYRRLLVDLSRATAMEDCEAGAWAHAGRLAREPALRAMRIAYLGEPASADSIESLAALRGYFYQRFRSQGSALVWLCGEEALRAAA